MSLDEEKHRAVETWKDFDWKMYMMCFGSLEWLSTVVFDPEAFRANIKSTIISFCDQVPLWVKPRCGKQLYGEWELRSKADKNPIENQLGRMGSWSQQLGAERIESDSEHEGVEELQQEAGVEQEQQQAGVEGKKKGFTQKRGFEGDGGDRYRITIELLQELLHWYDMDQQPLSRHGSHCSS